MHNNGLYLPEPGSVLSDLHTLLHLILTTTIKVDSIVLVQHTRNLR